jgi:hypothetical protein
MGFCGRAAADLDHAVLLTGFDVKGRYYNVRNRYHTLYRAAMEDK